MPRVTPPCPVPSGACCCYCSNINVLTTISWRLQSPPSSAEAGAFKCGPAGPGHHVKARPKGAFPLALGDPPSRASLWEGSRCEGQPLQGLGAGEDAWEGALSYSHGVGLCRTFSKKKVYFKKGKINPQKWKANWN